MRHVELVDKRRNSRSRSPNVEALRDGEVRVWFCAAREQAVAWCLGEGGGVGGAGSRIGAWGSENSGFPTLFQFHVYFLEFETKSDDVWSTTMIS